MKSLGNNTCQNNPPDNATKSMLPVVGIGASAGGLDALQSFFAHVPSSTGLAFIVVTHQKSEHVSLLPELLKKYTTMQIITAEDGMHLNSNCVFICPPGKNLALYNQHLRLKETGKFDATNLPIDTFFRSLADVAQEMSIGIILSGTGTDGTLGLKAIKGASGMTMVQDPKTAKFDGMPSYAMAMVDVDFVLPTEKMGQQLVEYVKGPYFNRMHTITTGTILATPLIQKILTLLRNRTGHDLALYKPMTIQRRIIRRMNIHQIKNPDKYLEFLQENPIEVDKLFKELLINVTSFFSDSAAFETLSDEILPKLFASKPDNDELRVWVTGCSSGEEAYSMAIIIKEYLEKTGRYCSVQIFATDLDELSINKARKGCYSSGIAADISADRLQRFFRLQDNQYYICKEIRDTVIFATQNLIQDPPFTHLDFISCRNLLIYLSVELQKKIFPQFHYALNPNGILFLGSSESIGDYEELFSIVSKKWKIYQRKEARVSIPVSKLNLPMVRLAELPQEQQKSLEIKHPSGKIAQQIERFLLDNFTPASVIIDEFGKILYIQGHTGKYLEPKSGQPTWNVIDMAREGLRLPLVTALRKANKQSDIEPVRSSISVKTNSHFEAIDLNVLKITAPEALRGLLLVSFIPQEKKIPLPSPRKKPASARLDNSDQNEQLAQELYFTKESLRVTIDELQTSNEELQSTIEELQSTNEELQSANEELETSKEEMQSLNEELNVANGELQNKVEALSAINDDMQNLLNSTDIATIFLDTHLKIKRFTKQAKNIIKLIDSDIGRPLDDLISNLYYDHLIDDAKDVLDTLINKATEVQTKSGDWYLLRILPYRTAENMIDGLVIAFVDINKLKKAEKSVHEAELTTAIVNTINQPLLVLDDQWTILTANPSFNQQFNHCNEELIGQSLFSINQSSWDSVLLKEALSNTLAKAIAFNGLCYDAVFAGIGQRKLLINGRILKQSSAGQALILLAIEDITERV